MILDQRGTKITFNRRRRRKGLNLPVIVVLFLAGIVLIFVAVSSGDKETEAPEEPESREIVAHASSVEDRVAVPIQLQEAAADVAEDQGKGEKTQNSAALPVNPSNKKQPAPPPADITGRPTEEARTANAAMFDLAAQPVRHGFMAPQVGKYAIIASALAYSPDASAADIAAAQASTYTVISGDILGKIAQKHGCTIEQLQKANRMENDQIKIGQKLLIPDCKQEVQPLVAESPPPAASRGKWWRKVGVNTTELPRLMAAEGFKPPQKFMALIVEFTFDSTRQIVIRERAFDYKGTSSSISGWNPASAIKIFAAVGALRRIDELGFTSRARVTFNGPKPYSTTIHELIEGAIINSNNIFYNRVVQLASYDKLHREILTSKYGIMQTALNRGYELTKWKEMGEDPSLKVSPSITLVEGKKKMTLPAQNSNATSVCSSAACTSLQDLAELSRRLMLQEQLPSEESFNLKNDDLIMLRRAMRSPDRTRGTEMVDHFAAIFKDPRIRFYSKPGFSEDWFTDNAYIYDPTQNQAWVVVMSGYPGRHALDSAATAIAKIIHGGKLRSIQ